MNPRFWSVDVWSSLAMLVRARPLWQSTLPNAWLARSSNSMRCTGSRAGRRQRFHRFAFGWKRRPRRSKRSDDDDLARRSLPFRTAEARVADVITKLEELQEQARAAGQSALTARQRQELDELGREQSELGRGAAELSEALREGGVEAPFLGRLAPWVGRMRPQPRPMRRPSEPVATVAG